MNLKNYTSAVDSEKSIAKIEKILMGIGVKNINKEYNQQTLVSIKFLIDVKGTTVAFCLPAKVQVVFDVLWKAVKKPQPSTKKRVQDQAARTAWKIISDWVEVQASMIYLEQAEVLQVFLPYAMVSPEKTVYQAIQDGGMQLLLPQGK